MSGATVKNLAAQLPELIAQADALVSRAECLLGAADELAKLIERATWHARGLPGAPVAAVPAARYVAQRLADAPAERPPGAAGQESNVGKNFAHVETRRRSIKKSTTQGDKQ